MRTFAQGFLFPRILVVLVWLSCIPLFAAFPWDLADDEEMSLQRAHVIDLERTRMAGEAAPPQPSEHRRATVRLLAWIEWLSLATATLGGLAVALRRGLSVRPWVVGTIAFASLYLLCRGYFEYSSYAETIRAITHQDARTSRQFLLEVAPLSFAYMLYFNFIVPVLLFVVPLVTLLKQRARQ